MYKLIKFKSPYNSAIPCNSCDLKRICLLCLNQDATVKTEVKNQISNMLLSDSDRFKELLSLTIKCKRLYPEYQIKDKRVTEYRLVGRAGNEILTANSFFGFIGSIFGTTIFAFIALMVIAMIICGIGSLFK